MSYILSSICKYRGNNYVNNQHPFHNYSRYFFSEITSEVAAGVEPLKENICHLKDKVRRCKLCIKYAKDQIESDLIKHKRNMILIITFFWQKSVFPFLYDLRISTKPQFTSKEAFIDAEDASVSG